MKEIRLLLGDSIIQAIVDAFYAVKNEPITVCGNGVRVIIMKDYNDEISDIEPKRVVKVILNDSRNRP